MSLDIQIAIRYGFEFTSESREITLRDENGTHVLQFPLGPICISEIADLMNKIALANNISYYSFSVDSEKRVLTILRPSGDAFEILAGSGAEPAPAYEMFGFTLGQNLSGQSEYRSNQRFGSIFYPQLPVTNFQNQNRRLRQATKSESSDGKCTEIVHCGKESTISFEVKAQTNIEQTCRAFRPTRGLDDIRDLLDWAICGREMELIPNCDKPDEYFKVILESTQSSRNGTEYNLIEMIRTLGCGYFRTGTLTFRILGGTISDI